MMVVVLVYLFGGCFMDALALITLTVTTAGLEISQTPMLILNRRVIHRRLAMIQEAVCKVRGVMTIITLQRCTDVRCRVINLTACTSITILRTAIVT